jgi:hypothetical protein
MRRWLRSLRQAMREPAAIINLREVRGACISLFLKEKVF